MSLAGTDPKEAGYSCSAGKQSATSPCGDGEASPRLLAGSEASVAILAWLLLCCTGEGFFLKQSG